MRDLGVACSADFFGGLNVPLFSQQFPYKNIFLRLPLLHISGVGVIEITITLTLLLFRFSLYI